VQVGLHDDGEQRLVDPPAAFEQRREERPGTQLGDAQLKVAGGGRQDPGPVAVTLRLAGLGALVRGAGELSLDEGLVGRLGSGADAV
jgi:hypothetical protein